MDYEQKIKDEVSRAVGRELTRAIMNPQFINMMKKVMGDDKPKKMKKKKDEKTGELF